MPVGPAGSEKSFEGIPIARGVIRFAYGQSDGWNARITRQGVLHSKYFAISEHGSAARALRQANAWRRKMERELGEPKKLGRFEWQEPGSWYVARRSYTVKDRRGEPYAYEVWEATYYRDWGTIDTRRWSVRKHGDKEAKRLARRWARERRREDGYT